MKTSTTISAIFCVLTFGLFGQHTHVGTEHFFESKSISQFEIDLDLEEEDFLNSDLINFVDFEYQLFHSDIEARVNNHEDISDTQFQNEYNGLLARTIASLDSIAQIPASPTSPFPPKAINGPCVNMDFEQGDLSGWTLTRGNVDGSVPFSYVGEFPVGPGPYHTIFGGGLDPVTGISRVNPLNGNFSARLGNGTGVGARAARMSQTFLVDATNYMFTYSYAVIFQSPAWHTLNQLPYFTVRVFDSLGNSVPCGEYTVIADAANAPNYQTTNWGGSIVLYRDWTTVFANLSAYIGQNVTVEFTSGDCSLTGHFGYAYIDATCGNSQIITSTDIICQGDSAILTAPAGAASYLWNTGATTQSITVTTGGVYSATLTPFAGGGCSITLDVTITEYPSPIANYTASTLVICENDSVYFNDFSTILAPGAIIGYRWDFGDGVISPISSGAIVGVTNTTGTYLSPAHLYTTAGNYVTQLYVETADGCTDSMTINVQVNASPIVVAGPDVTVCQGSMVTLSGSGASSYVWDNGVIDNVPFLPPVGATTYTVVGTNANGCSNTDNLVVTVNAYPGIQTNASSTVVCEGVGITLTGSGGVSYLWNNGVTDGIGFIPPVGVTNYIVTGTDANGCQGTDNIDITVNALPTVVAGPDVVVCDGASVALSGAGAVSYTWNNGITNGVAFYPAIGTVTYTVTGTDVNGCQNTDNVDVTVNANPVIQANASNTSICLGQSVTLYGAGGTSYSWDSGVIDNVAFTPSVGVVTYTVIGTDANACSNTDQINVTVYDLPVVVAGIDQEVCDGIAVTLVGNGAISYVWDNAVINAVAFYPLIGTTTYTVIGTDANGCTNSDNVDVTVNPLPTISAGADNQLCDLNSIVLAGSGASTYTWTNGVMDNVAFYPSIGTTTYTVTGTDAKGCQNTDDVDITVYGLPNVVGGPDQTVCEGTMVTLSGSGANSYAWTGGITNGVPFLQNPGQLQYIVTGTDANACSNSDTVIVLVNSNPVVNAGADQQGCDGNTVTLNAQGTSNLYWSNGVLNNVPFTQNVGSMTYVVTDSLATGCTSTDTVEVIIYNNPIVSAEGAEICAGEEVILSGQGADNYSWTGGVVDGIGFYPTVSSSYTVTGYNIYGCSSDATVQVIVHELPVADFNILQLSLTTLDPTTGFDNLSTGAVSYMWDFGDYSPNSYDFEPEHTFPTENSGAYAITLTAYSSYGCEDERTKYVHIFQDYTIYVPNAFTPDYNGVNEVFKPEMDGFDPYEYTLYIFNRWGNLIFESHNMEIGWDGRFANQKDQSQDGVYTWKIVAGLLDSPDTKIFVGHVSLLK
ncbi:MAG: gliding motility-associated C-terminal domain-containing protein [Fluviicola sp.]|nr:gliding motility-associated C-terminal domain-containing protein [Fluviicola sp.]